jgi:peroxiredoxin
VIGVPGAFTPPCSSHVPGYVTDAGKFAAKGIKGIYIVAVNDTFTTQAWKEKLGGSSPNVHFLADDDCKFTKAAGMSFDASGLLGNTRSQRYVAVVEVSLDMSCGCVYV